MTAPHIALDWGSSNLRAFLLDGDGAVLDQVGLPAGILHIGRADIPGIVQRLRDRWPDTAGGMTACGMIGSNRGWQVLPYRDCPIRWDDLRHAGMLVRIGREEMLISSGLSCRSHFDNVEVMRGEEVQALGWHLDHPGHGDSLLCLPGTHCKWAVCDDDGIRHFSSAMTGELYDLRARHSILADALAPAPLHAAAFTQGVERGAAGENPGRTLFALRGLSLLQGVSVSQTASLARGLLIGAEVAEAVRAYGPAGPVQVIGFPPVCDLYVRAIRHLGGDAIALEGDRCGIAGLRALEKRQ